MNMYRKLMSLISRELSGARARDRVEEITRYHRIQASPGIREASMLAARRLEEAGLEVEVLEFPADGKTRFWSSLVPEEWDCREAWLELDEGDGKSCRLACFGENPVSLIQRSAPTPEGGVEAEVVVLESADQEEAYREVDVEGRVVLTRADVNRVHRLAVEERGAVGILTDKINYSEPARPELDLPDARQYTSFWWSDQERKGFGFVLTPRQGADLRRRARKAQKAGERPPVVRAMVDSAIYPGKIEVVSGLIPGCTDEEVLVVAHTCHPRPSANDNASGAGLALEMARALARLIERGDLEKPARSIRFLLVPEMTGTYAYLAGTDADPARIVAGVNLDMVGQNQELCRGTLQVESPPRAMPSFTADLLREIMEGVAQEATNLAGSSRFSTFRWTVTGFSGGSDHYILSDPTVGVPCPMLIQWPDRFYHTDQDTMDKVDPDMLKRVGVAAAVYAAFVARAGLPEAAWLAHQMTARFASRLNEAVVGLWEEDPVSLRLVSSRLGFLASCQLSDLASLEALIDRQGREAWDKILKSCQEEVAEALRRTVSRLDWLIKESGVAEAEMDPQEEGGEELDLVPRRLVPGPIALRDDILPPEKREDWYRLRKKHARALSSTIVAIYWMNGERTLGEVLELTELETGQRHPEFVTECLKILESAGLVSMESRGEDKE